MTPTVRRAMIAAILLALVVAYAAVPGFAAIGGPVLNSYNLSAVVSAVILIAAVVVRRPQPMWPWLLIAAAVLSWVVGDAVYILHGGSPIISFADAFYIPAYFALIVACLRVLRARMGQRDVDSLIDSAMVTIAAALALWELVVQPALNASGPSTTEQILAALYPLLDVILLCMLIQLLLVPGRRLLSLVLLTTGMGSILFADTIYAVLAQTNSYGGNAARALDATWLLGYALFPIAALHPSMLELTRPLPLSVDRPRRGRLFISGAALVAVPLVVFLRSLLGRDPGLESTTLAALALVPFVLWRILRLNRSSERARAAIARQESYYRALATNSSDVFAVIDGDARILDASGPIQALMGLSAETAIGADGMSIILEEDRALAAALLHDSLDKPGVTVSGEMRIATANGRQVWAELRFTNLLDDPAVEGIVVNTHDITSRKQFEQELSHQAFHDSLTSLANRALLKDRIDHALARRGPGNDVAVVFCDLDGFKLVNDTLGHDAGDEMLRIAGRRLSAVVRTADTVARLGGDEFAVLLEATSRPVEDAGVIAERMRSALADPAEIVGVPLVVTGSLGLAVASEGGQTTSDELLRDADTAMYRAKAAGRNRVARYKPSMRAADLSRRQIGLDLSAAVARDELVVHYQPVVQLDTQRLVGFEALVRWDHPTRGRLQPDDFVAIAEETGAIVEIGMWVLNRACRTARTWQCQMPDDAPFTMSVNLSARQLTHPTLVADVADALAASGLPAGALVLELTESVIVENPDEVATRLRALKALGVRIAIDDFGVGYSSLSYLRQFPVDILKIDRSFVEAIHSDERVPAIVHGILELARTLGLETVAEGIETVAQQLSLASEHCELGQGYLFGKPLDQQAATTLLNQQAVLDQVGFDRALAQPHTR